MSRIFFEIFSLMLFFSKPILPTSINQPVNQPADAGKTALTQLLWLLQYDNLQHTSEEEDDNATSHKSDESVDYLPKPLNLFDSMESQMTQEQILFHHLFRRYNKAVRPSDNPQDVVDIHLGMTLAKISDIDMKQQKMVAMFWCDQEWVDHRLRWNTDDFYGITRLHVPFGKIWMPDIVLYNSVYQDKQHKAAPMDMLAKIKSDGTVFYAPVVLHHSYCRLNPTYFPYDTQFCWLKLGSWAHTGDVLNVEIRGEGIDISNHLGNGEWELIGTKAVKNIKYYPCCPEPFPEIFFYFRLRRRLLYYGKFVLRIIPLKI